MSNTIESIATRVLYLRSTEDKIPSASQVSSPPWTDYIPPITNEDEGALWFTVEKLVMLHNELLDEPVDFVRRYTKPAPFRAEFATYFDQINNPVWSNVATTERGFVLTIDRTTQPVLNQQYVDRVRPQSLPYAESDDFTGSGKIINDLLPNYGPNPVVSQSITTQSGSFYLLSESNFIANNIESGVELCLWSTFRTTLPGSSIFSEWSPLEYYGCPRNTFPLKCVLPDGSTVIPLFWLWEPGVDYKKGDIVTAYRNNYNSRSEYICTEDHTSAIGNFYFTDPTNVTDAESSGTIYAEATRYWNDYSALTRAYPF